MVNFNTSDTETFVVIKRNTQCMTYGFTRDSEDNIVQNNGVIIISTDYEEPYDSFAHLIDPAHGGVAAMVAYVVNLDTGEVRYYDGTQTLVTDFIDPKYDSVGFIKAGDFSINRTVESIPEIGSTEPVDLKQTNVTYDINIEKMYSGRWKTAYATAALSYEKPAAVTTSTKIVNPIGFTGIQAMLDQFNSTDAGESGHTPYFMIIFYGRDASDSTNRRAMTDIFVCCRMGDTVQPKIAVGGTYVENMKFKASRHIHAPRDVYQPYTKSFSPVQQ